MTEATFLFGDERFSFFFPGRFAFLFFSPEATFFLSGFRSSSLLCLFLYNISLSPNPSLH